MVKRDVKISKTHSFFLFGARATGKSTLLEKEFPRDQALWIDLLYPATEDRFSRNPDQLRHVIAAAKASSWVVIDEIQKVPELLNVIHSLSKNPSLHFALTGSSARKLKRGGRQPPCGAGLQICLSSVHPPRIRPPVSPRRCSAIWGLAGHFFSAARGAW